MRQHVEREKEAKCGCCWCWSVILNSYLRRRPYISFLFILRMSRSKWNFCYNDNRRKKFLSSKIKDDECRILKLIPFRNINFIFISWWSDSIDIFYQLPIIFVFSRGTYYVDENKYVLQFWHKILLQQ